MDAFETEQGVERASVRESVEGWTETEEATVGSWDADGAAEVGPNAKWARGAEGMVSGLEGREGRRTDLPCKARSAPSPPELPPGVSVRLYGC